MPYTFVDLRKSLADIKTADLAKKHGITQKALHAVIADAGLDIRKSAKIIPEEFVEELEIMLADKDMVAQAQEEKKEESDNLIEIPESLSIMDFAKKIEKPVTEVMKILIMNGMMLNQNEFIDFDTAELVATELLVEIKKEKAFSEKKREELNDQMKQEEGAETRAPVVSIMGHVDHGKTTLLDAIRGGGAGNVAGTEAGGITQSIGAYQVSKHGEKITFLDTPGHEAFTEMRARGAQATDIAVLVVAADDGIMPQTREAIAHARAAGVPIIVAATKIDSKGANLDNVLGQLAQEELVPESWGGDTMVVPVSGLTGEGIDKLEEAILLQAEVLELKAKVDRTAIGFVIEAHLDQKLGPVATMLVRAGTFKKNDILVVGKIYGRVRLMLDDHARMIGSAGPSVPVLISGLSEVPRAGELFEVKENLNDARTQAEAARLREDNEKAVQNATLAKVSEQIREGLIKDLKIVLKCDTKGSLEALSSQILDIGTDKVTTNIIHSDIGPPTNADVMMAKASGAVVIAFNVRHNPAVEAHAENEGIIIKFYDVIYDIIEDLKQTLSGLLAPEVVETLEATCKVKAIFFHGKGGEYIVGLSVEDGTLLNNLTVKVLRGGEEVGKGKVTELKRAKENVKEVTSGHECGIKFSGKILPEEGDVFECYSKKEVKHEINL